MISKRYLERSSKAFCWMVSPSAAVMPSEAPSQSVTQAQLDHRLLDGMDVAACLFQDRYCSVHHRIHLIKPAPAIRIGASCTQ